MFAFKERTNVEMKTLMNSGTKEAMSIVLVPSTTQDEELRTDVRFSSINLGANDGKPSLDSSGISALRREHGEMDLYILCLEQEDMSGEGLEGALSFCKDLWKERVDGAEVEAEGKIQRSRHRAPISVVFVRGPPSAKPRADATPPALAVDLDSDTDEWWQENKVKFQDEGIFPQGVLCIPSVMGPGTPLSGTVGTSLGMLVADYALREPPAPPTPPKKSGFVFSLNPFGRRS